jgi:hypothetical protein
MEHMYDVPRISPYEQPTVCGICRLLWVYLSLLWAAGKGVVQ